MFSSKIGERSVVNSTIQTLLVRRRAPYPRNQNTSHVCMYMYMHGCMYVCAFVSVFVCVYVRLYVCDEV